MCCARVISEELTIFDLKYYIKPERTKAHKHERKDKKKWEQKQGASLVSHSLFCPHLPLIAEVLVELYDAET